GLTVLPFLTGRLDVQGAIVWPLLAWCVLRSRKGDMFAAIWGAVATIEIGGTWAGDWGWAASAPWSHLPSGNPPSAIAAGYAVIDGAVLLVAPRLAAALRALGGDPVEVPASGRGQPLLPLVLGRVESSVGSP